MNFSKFLFKYYQKIEVQVGKLTLAVGNVRCAIAKTYADCKSSLRWQNS